MDTAANPGRGTSSASRFWLAGLLILGVGTGVDAFWIEPYWIEVTQHELQAPVGPPVRIAHLTDLHTRGLGKREEVLLEELDSARPDLIVITGDTLSGRGTPEQTRPLLSKLSAPLGVWKVRGNWENWRPAPNERRFYGSLGITLLHNTSREVRPGLWLAGLDDAATGRPNIGQALQNVPEDAYVIALFHSPVLFDQMAGKAPLALAGHTHGGQVRLPLIGPLWLPKGCGSYLSGWYEKGESRMYVSRGIGTSVLDVRFYCRPELAVITVGG